MGLFDAGSLPTIAPPASLAERYKRRAYGSITATGNDQFSGCAGGYTLSFDNTGDKKYSQGGALNSRGGGRYTPQPYLTSITTKNQGGGDITDLALWEIEFQYTCWSTSQLNTLSDAFMIPGNLINVKFGWNTGDSVSISGARIYDFSWSYNDDGSWSCTGKALGESSSVGAFRVKPTNSPKAYKNASGGNERKAYGPIKLLQAEGDEALGITRNEEGAIEDGFLEDGTAKAVNGYALINLQKEAGAWDMFWSGGGADNMYISFASISKLISFFNSTSMENGYKIVCDANYKAMGRLKSADPSSVLLPGIGANYGTGNNFDTIGGAVGTVSDIYVSTTMLLKVEEELMDREKDKSGNPSYTVSTFLSRMFAEIESCTGGAVNCAVIPHPTSKEILIVNKHFDIKSSGGGTTISLLGESSPVKSVSMSSNFDPEMAAIAFAGGSGRFPEKMASNIFSGCKPKDVKKPADPVTAVNDKINEIGGGGFKAELVSDFKTVLRTYAMGQVDGVSIRYNIDLSLTFDGVAGVAFMQKFNVSPLPSGFAGNTYFAVGEIEHKCDGQVWDTSVVGYMMVNV